MLLETRGSQSHRTLRCWASVALIGWTRAHSKIRALRRSRNAMGCLVCENGTRLFFLEYCGNSMRGSKRTCRAVSALLRPTNVAHDTRETRLSRKSARFGEVKAIRRTCQWGFGACVQPFERDPRWLMKTESKVCRRKTIVPVLCWPVRIFRSSNFAGEKC